MAKPIVILDFDRVLFDTDGYVLGLLESVRDFGATKEIWDKAYAKRPKSEIFTFEKMADELSSLTNANKDDLVAAMQKETDDGVWYLYSDARPFLESIKNKADVYLLTFGDEEIQQRKLDATGIADYFTDVVITSEAKHLNKSLPITSVSRAIFLNDNVREIMDLGGLYRWSWHLHINRDHNELPPNFPFTSFPSLREALPSVLGLIDAQTTGQPADGVADQRS